MNGHVKFLFGGALAALLTVPVLAGPPGPHHYHGGSSGVRLATDIVNLVRTAISPIVVAPAPVVYSEPAPVVYSTPVVYTAPPRPYYYQPAPPPPRPYYGRPGPGPHYGPGPRPAPGPHHGPGPRPAPGPGHHHHR